MAADGDFYVAVDSQMSVKAGQCHGAAGGDRNIRKWSGREDLRPR
jgi:hypothetical protein